MQDLLGDTDQCALSQVRRERAAAATRAADFQESRRRLAAKREEKKAVRATGRERVSNVGSKPPPPTRRGVAAARKKYMVAWYAKRKEARERGHGGVAQPPSHAGTQTTTINLRCLGSSKRVLPPAEAEEESESDSEEEEEGPSVEDLAAFGIVEGTCLPFSFPSVREFTALRERRGAFEEVAARIAADEEEEEEAS